jgi:hypothetical protein
MTLQPLLRQPQISGQARRTSTFGNLANNAPSDVGTLSRKEIKSRLAIRVRTG